MSPGNVAASSKINREIHPSMKQSGKGKADFLDSRKNNLKKIHCTIDRPQKDNYLAASSFPHTYYPSLNILAGKLTIHAAKLCILINGCLHVAIGSWPNANNKKRKKSHGNFFC